MLRSTGIVRRVDSLGRIVLPVALRRHLDLNQNDEIEIYVDGDRIVLRKRIPDCFFCGSTDRITEFKGKEICRQCLVNMAQFV